MVSFTLKIVNIRKETEDTVTLCFKQPAIRKIKYKAGQYLTLIFRINGRRYVRPYSFSSAPSVDALIEVTVKRIPNGIISNHILDRVQIGDLIEVMGPMGDFTYEPKGKPHSIFFWGVGSGITPLISLIKEVLNSDSLVTVNLIYGNRNFESTIFSDQINSLLNEFSERFNVWYFHTQLTVRDGNPYIVEGRINSEFALSILKRIEAMNTSHYICGPTGLKESVKKALSLANVPPQNIFSEEFVLIKDPKDFENILTRTISLHFQNVSHVLEVIKGKSILESALDSGLELPYSCQTGHCSTCKAKCVKGELKMIGLDRERSDLQKDEYLLCCTHPLSDNVQIEI